MIHLWWQDHLVNASESHFIFFMWCWVLILTIRQIIEQPLVAGKGVFD